LVDKTADSVAPESSPGWCPQEAQLRSPPPGGEGCGDRELAQKMPRSCHRRRTHVVRTAAGVV